MSFKISEVLILLSCLLALCLCENKTLNIGFSYSTTINNPFLPEETSKQLALMSNFLYEGAMAFQAYSNDVGPMTIGNESYFINVTVMEDDYTQAKVASNYDFMVSEGIDFFISGFGTSLTNFAASVTELQSKILVSTTTTSPTAHVNRTHTFSVYPSVYMQTIQKIPYLRVAGVETVTFIRTTNAPPQTSSNTACDGVEEEFIKSSINQFHNVFYDGNVTAEFTNYREVAQEAMDINSDLILFCGTDGLVLVNILKEMQKVDYVPKAGLTTTFEFDWKEDKPLIDFWVLGSVLTESDFGYPEGHYIKSEADYIKYLKLYFGQDHEVDDFRYKIGYFSVIAIETMLKAMQNGGTVDPNIVKDEIRRNVYTSFLGEVYYDAANQLMTPGTTIQDAYNKTYIIGPYQVSNSLMIYPMPKWSERYLHDAYTNVEIAVIVFLSLGLVNSVAWLIVIIIKRNKKEINASSPVFLVGMLVGSILIYISLFFWIPKHISSVSCSIHVAFLLFGFMLLFGSMVVKTWRVHLIFSRKSLEVFHITNTQVALFLAILLSVDIVLYIIWIVLTKPVVQRAVVKEFFVSYDYFYCTTTTGGTVLIWIMVGYHGLIFLYGAYLALRVRTIPFKIYDESKIIAFCIYNVGLISIIVAILEGTNSASRLTQVGLRSFLIIISTAITINTMFIGKFAVSKLIGVSTSDDSSYSSKMQSTSNSSNSSQISENTENKRLMKQNRALKREIKDLRSALDVLKGAD